MTTKTETIEGTVAEYVTAVIGGQLFGLPISRVQDVFMPERLTRVPLSSSEIAGVLNLRGRIVTVIDLKRLLHGASAHEEAMNMVVRFDNDEVSLLIDRIGDVMRVDEAAVEATPPTLQGLARDFIRGVFPLQDGLLLLLDTQRMLDDERCHLTAPVDGGRFANGTADATYN